MTDKPKEKKAFRVLSEYSANVKQLRQKAKKAFYCFNKEQTDGYYKGPNGLDRMQQRLEFMQITRNKIIEFNNKYNIVHAALEKAYTELTEKEIDLEKMIEAEETTLFMDEKFYEDTEDPECLF